MFNGFAPVLSVARLSSYLLFKGQQEQANECHENAKHLIPTEGLVKYEVVECGHYDYRTLNYAVRDTCYSNASTDVCENNGKGCEETDSKGTNVFY